MSKYFIPEIVCSFSNREAMFYPKTKLPNEIVVWNDNIMDWQVFKNVRRSETQYGWIGEADELQSYFSQVIKEIPESICTGAHRGECCPEGNEII